MDKIQDEIIEEFAVFDDWLDKYDYLIELSDSLPPMDPAHKTDEYLINGCQSRLWIDARMQDGKVYYSADSDAIITKGITALLMRVMNGRTDSRHRPILHRCHRSQGEPLAHAQQRTAGHDQADAHVCPRLQRRVAGRA